MFNIDDKIFNTKSSRFAKVIRTHENEGKLTATGQKQNAYTVEVNGVWKVWLEKTDFLVYEE